MGICKDEALQPEITELRRNAEALLKAKSPDAYLFRKGEDNLRLIQELEIHRIELEMQNAELRLARCELELALERFTDLYEFAPVGYLTLDSTGIINSLNLASASLIGGGRSRLIGCNFRQFVAATHRLSFSDFLGKVLTCQVKESCDVALLKNGIIVQIEAMVTASGEEFRLALIDITEKRRSEDALAVKQRELEDLNSCLVVRIADAVSEQRRMDQIAIMQDRRAAMGEMIGNIAHQWRQPLNVLGLNLQDLPLAYGKAEFTKEYLNASVSQSMQLIMHMSNTIDDFRNFFKVDKEKVTFSVNQVIKKTLALVEESFKEQMICTVFNSKSDPKVVGYATFPGVMGTAVTKICQVEVGRTGLQEKEIEALGLEHVSAVIKSRTKAGYFPGAGEITVKLLAEKGSGRLLGGQIVGMEASAKRIDTLATALHAGFTVEEMINLDLGYAPPFSPVWDPVVTAAREVAKKL